MGFSTPGYPWADQPFGISSNVYYVNFTDWFLSPPPVGSLCLAKGLICPVDALRRNLPLLVGFRFSGPNVAPADNNRHGQQLGTKLA